MVRDNSSDSSSLGDPRSKDLLAFSTHRPDILVRDTDPIANPQVPKGKYKPLFCSANYGNIRENFKLLICDTCISQHFLIICKHLMFLQHLEF